MDRTRTALREMARDDPELAARLVLQTLPAASARIPAPLRYHLMVDDIGTWLVSVDHDGARVEPATVEPDGDLDFTLRTDAAGLAELAAGGNPMRLGAAGRLRIPAARPPAHQAPP